MPIGQSTLEPNRQEQKSERARLLLCESTVTCLTEFGYAETSISRVLQIAQVSKGALQHHYPSKEDLMAATAQHLLRRPLQQQPWSKQESALSNPATREAAVRKWLTGTWNKMINTGPYHALLEILLATRTDALLHQRISGELEDSIRVIDEHFCQQYPDLDEARKAQLLALLCANRCLLRGLLIEAQYGLTATTQKMVLKQWWGMLTPLLLGHFDTTPELGDTQ
jgi:AcrR family transcriptional regulator